MKWTILGKLKIGLAVVLAISVITSVGGIWGLLALQNVVRDFDYAITKAPHQTELVDLASSLLRPLQPRLDPRLNAEGTKQFIVNQEREFHAALRSSIQKFFNFRLRVEMASSPDFVTGRTAVSDQVLNTMQARLGDLQRNSETIVTREKYEAQSQRRRWIVSQLVLDAYLLPDPSEGFQRELQRARKMSESVYPIVITTSITSLVLFLGLVWYGYKSIFKRIQELHRGAVRVAGGEYNYRVTIPGEDEMADLAEALNKMTRRFQETKNELDTQVQIRSRQLVRSERLAGVGFLAAGVAHEINNPLSAIQMAADSLLSRVPDVRDAMTPEDYAVVFRYLTMIDEESQRCRGITARLLDFARGGSDTSRMRINLTELISEVLQMVQLLTKHRGKQVEFNRTTPCYAECNGPEIKQVLLNLVANGLEASGEGDVLRIELTEQTDQVVLRIQDNGCGMSPEVKENLFEPFFTQKQGGQGTGLGLSITHRIIHDHGGTIMAESDGPGRGSTFSVRLPKTAPAQNAAA